jgi:predicted metal-dependent enzyme (double-stranded beta helix superfamily)
MFDIDGFIEECQRAMAETEPRLAIKEVVDRAVSVPGEVERALPPERAEIVPLHVSDDLSILKVVWAPNMRFRPHNHLMWATIGLYGGQEDNTFYRRVGAGLTSSGGRELLTGEAILLGDDTIHAVTNPRRSYTGAIHVYGGNITARPGRSEWEEPQLQEVPYDFERTRKTFEQANATVDMKEA